MRKILIIFTLSILLLTSNLFSQSQWNVAMFMTKLTRLFQIVLLSGMLFSHIEIASAQSTGGNSTTFYVPNSAGTLWTVFDFDNSSGFNPLNTMADESNSRNVDDHWKILFTMTPKFSRDIPKHLDSSQIAYWCNSH